MTSKAQDPTGSDAAILRLERRVVHSSPPDPAALATDTGDAGPVRRTLRRRRLALAALVLGTVAVLVTAMVVLLRVDGLSGLEAGMLALFALNTPWVALGFWNAVIGLAVLAGSRDPIAVVTKGLRRPAADAPVHGRVALVVPVYNEDAARVFACLRATWASMEATGHAGRFSVFILSDSKDPRIIAEEEALFAAWRAEDPRPDRLHYRRRPENVGLKAGNLWEFCHGDGAAFDCMVVLDADSVMSGAAILRLVRTMEANPRLGILQSLPVGLPAASPFARIFQFGMRHGMRPHTVGSAWWQGPEGPYWGHNAAVRLAPFREHCALPKVPGRPPLGGHVLSHDQVEAVLMQRGGYEVRALPAEEGSFEENPPTLPDFMKRDLRWCLGNMQYIRLLGLPGLRPMGRLQLVLAIMMYLSAPIWLGFLALTFTQADGAVPSWWGFKLGLGLFATMIMLTLVPKLCGVIDVLLRRRVRRAYGGTGRLLAGGVLELLFSILIAPILSVTQTLFMGSLLFGRQVRWEAQVREGHVIAPAEALRGLWPHTLLGLAAAWHLSAADPLLVALASPILAGLILAAPFAWFTSLPGPGRILSRARLCATPEELEPTPVVRAVAPALVGAPALQTPALAEPLPASTGTVGR